MIVADRADRVEAVEIVAERREIAVPGDDVERAVIERRRPQVRRDISWISSTGPSRSSWAAPASRNRGGLARPLEPIGKSGRPKQAP
jgi:hypothetical protein